MDHAVGTCVQCRKNTTYSKYWVKVGNRIGDFEPGIDRPLCSAECAEAYYQKKIKGSVASDCKND